MTRGIWALHFVPDGEIYNLQDEACRWVAAYAGEPGAPLVFLAAFPTLEEAAAYLVEEIKSNPEGFSAVTVPTYSY